MMRRNARVAWIEASFGAQLRRRVAVFRAMRQEALRRIRRIHQVNPRAPLAYLLPQGAYCKNARKEAKGDRQWKLELNPIPIINCAKP
jgi:hypothetical protein